jgi:Protein of unknown function (DUF5131)
MRRTFEVRRETSEQPDGQDRWDRAYQIEQQVAQLQAFVAAREGEGWTVADEHVFRDDGCSGARLAWPGRVAGPGGAGRLRLGAGCRAGPAGPQLRAPDGGSWRSCNAAACGVRELDERYRPCPGRALARRADLGGDGAGPAAHVPGAHQAAEAARRDASRSRFRPSGRGSCHGDHLRYPAWSLAHGYDRLDPEGGTDDQVWMPPWPLPNTWAGTSIESDDYTWRADVLRQVPAATRLLSLEPLLGPLRAAR